MSKSPARSPDLPIPPYWHGIAVPPLKSQALSPEPRYWAPEGVGEITTAHAAGRSGAALPEELRDFTMVRPSTRPPVPDLFDHVLV